MTETPARTRFQMPGSIRLLTAQGVRGHSLIFSLIMIFVFSTASAAQFLGPSQAWTAIFIVGASSAGTYLVLAALSLLQRTRTLLLQSQMKIRIITLATIFGSTLAGLSYWISQAGSVEALPIFPAFIAIFYAWVLLQSFFIATPVSHILARVENAVAGEGGTKKAIRTLGTISLFAPVVPLLYGVWAISSWASNQYQSIQGSGNQILLWSVMVTIALLFTYYLTLRWSWSNLQKTPQTAIFIGGIFLILWAYLLYRATSMLTGYITQTQPSSPILDASLILVSIIGAMQTLAGKLSKRSEGKWAEVFPFLVFSFGSVYAVAQFYFILQFAISRIELSILINATVFATGLSILMLIIRKHIPSAPTSSRLQSLPSEPINEPKNAIESKRSLFALRWRKKAQDVSEQSRPD